MTRSLRVPELMDGNISMSANDFRWLLMAHGALMRHVMAIEVERFGLEQARRNTKRFDRQRRRFIRRLQEQRT